MAATLSHRGPNSHGVWADAAAGVALAHRRLITLDHSAAGHQPLTSSDGRHVLVCDGGVQNFATLRDELARRGTRFRGYSDTEVLLAAITTWGLEESLQRCTGAFALALWDRSELCLWLARDRIGKKPLYYGWAGDVFVFGSELKALWQHPAFDNDVDRDALTLLLQLGHIPAPHCIHERTCKLMSGCLLRMDAATVAADAHTHAPKRAQRRFWGARKRMQAALAAPFTGSEADAQKRLESLLHNSVKQCASTDVSTGVFLSGGTDSSVITSIMQAQNAQPIPTFSIGFQGSRHNEAPLAREVAEYLGTDHTELYISGNDALEVVPHLPEIFDEPFADASQIPTALLTQLASKSVTVALSGDGGDELFFGYKRYRRALRVWHALSRIPLILREPFALTKGESSRLGGVAALRAELGARGIGDVYRSRVNRWRDPVAVVRCASSPPSFYDEADPLGGVGSPADAVMLADFVGSLPDGLLCKIDRTAAAVGLEARAPLLDWHIAEFAWSLPFDMKFRDGTSKYLLKRMLGRYLPEFMVYRGKRGFGAPVADWLRSDLHDWTGDLLSPVRLRRDGFFVPATVNEIHQRFGNGEHRWHTHLWSLLMFTSWLDHWRDCRASTRRTQAMCDY